MERRSRDVGAFLRIDKPRLQSLVDALRAEGYETILPQVSEGAVVYGPGDQVANLPIGLVDQQDGGLYRLHQSDQAGYFDYVVGPHSLKQYLFPARETVLEGHKEAGRWRFSALAGQAPRLAVVGVRSCDLHALAIQDRVFLEGPYVDEGYRARREGLFLVAVNCRRAAATCFCHSMQTGPAVSGGFDLALTEMDGHFVVEVGSAAGGRIAAALDAAFCDREQIAQAQQVPRRLEADMHEGKHGGGDASGGGPPGRRLDTTGIHDLLLNNLEHPRWDEVAERCLACANCTMVCPTCFCSSVNDVADLTDEHLLRERTWASCFTAEHSKMSSGVVRQSTRSRYRQWMVHKLATWIDQFDVSGCVGCGRCITWCPVGIDLTEEVDAIRGGGP